jgi:uncharacterized protein YcfL
MKKSLILIVSIFFLSGCASLKVIPEPVQNGIINNTDNSQSLTKDKITITARSGDVEIASYNLEGNVTSFFVVVNNQTDEELTINNDSFLLIDNDGRQYFPLTPEKVKEIIARDTYYLMPYPYVGFYYLEDYEKSSFYNRFTSDRPYFYEVYPQDIYTKAIPSGAIIPKAKVAGLVYFRIDIEGKKAVSLNVYKKGTSKSSPADFVFPFKIIK